MFLIDLPIVYFSRLSNFSFGDVLKVNFTILEKPFFFWFGIFFLKIMLDVSYVVFVHPVFAYSGFGLDASYIKYFESWLLLIAFAYFTPSLLLKPSDYLLFTVLYAFLIPLLSYYALNNQSRESLYISLLCCGLVYFFSKGRRFKIPDVRYGKSFAVFLCLSLSFISTLWFVYSSGFKYFNLNFNLVYEYRGAVSEASYKGVMAYVITWTTKVVGPALMGYAFFTKRYSLGAVVLLMHVIWFGFSSHKSVLFYPFLVIGLWVWFQKTRALASLSIVVSMILLVSLLLFLFYDQALYASMFIRRVFFVIAKNTFVYFDFFSANPKVFWSNSIASYFVDYPYYIEPAKLIGHYQGDESHSNNSYVSTAYMHAGVFGIVLYGILVGMLFRLFDSLAKNYLHVLLVLSAILVPSRSLILNADLPTALLTHGIGFALLIGFLMKRSVYTGK